MGIGHRAILAETCKGIASLEANRWFTGYP